MSPLLRLLAGVIGLGGARSPARRAASSPADAAALFKMGEALQEADPLEASFAYGRGLALELVPAISPASEGDLIELAGQLLRRIAQEPSGRWAARANEAGAFGFALARSGVYEAAGEPLLKIALEFAPRSSKFDRPGMRGETLIRLLGLDRASPVEWNLRVAEQVLRPWMRSAFESRRYHEALDLEAHIYQSVVMQSETEAHFRRCTALWFDLARAAGVELAARSRTQPDRAPLPRTDADDGPPRIGFFIHRASLLAHIRLFVGMLEGWAGLEPRPFVPVLYVFHGFFSELDERLAALGVRTVYLNPSIEDGGKSKYERLLALREHLREDGVDCLVWVSVVTMMPFAFGMRIAPAQVWWSMKYHSVELPEIDKYITSGGLARTKRIGGRDWPAVPTALGELYDPRRTAEAERIRASFGPGKLLLGTLGREAKLRSEPYLDAVVRILKACPQAEFLWAGRERDPFIDDWFARAAVADRCHYIGWVDTKLYAQVLDIFLDSFPFPCSVTLYECMAAGRPCVLFRSAEAYETGAWGMIAPILESSAPADRRDRDRLAALFDLSGERLLHCADTPQEYVSLALRLAADPDLRRRAGDAARSFAGEFLADRRRAAQIFVEHLRDVIGRAGHGR